MVRIQEVATAGQFVTLVKPVGKDIPLRLGEILEGQVVDLFPSGGLTIRVKGGFLPARTDLNFQKDQTILLKVVGQKGQNGELILQLMDGRGGASGKTEGVPVYPQGRQQLVENLTRQISDLVRSMANRGREAQGNSGGNAINFPVENGRLVNLLEGLLKALPGRIDSMPTALRAQIQQVLQNSLATLGQEVQERVAQLITRLAEQLEAPLLVESLKDRLLVSMDGLLSTRLKTALENSGVLLEARLKALVETKAYGDSSSETNDTKINKDLKAILLQFKEVLEKSEEMRPTAGGLQKLLNNGREEAFSPQQKTLGEVDGLLKDLETFQLLSKISDSFWTFLPVQWNELKKGDLVFKRRKASNGDVSYSCGIHLDLGEGGLVSVFIVSQFKDFYVSFKVEHAGLSARIDSSMNELKENFNIAGLHIKNITLYNNSDNISDPFEYPESGETIVNIRI